MHEGGIDAIIRLKKKEIPVLVYRRSYLAINITIIFIRPHFMLCMTMLIKYGILSNSFIGCVQWRFSIKRFKYDKEVHYGKKHKEQ